MLLTCPRLTAQTVGFTGAVRTLGSGFIDPFGVAADGSRSVYVADSGNNRVVELDHADPPNVRFANPTAVSSVDSTDEPQTVTAVNDGSAPLTFSSESFPTDSPQAGSGANRCTASTNLDPGQTCDLTFEFSPKSPGKLTEEITLTDNALNAAGTRQQIAVSGTALQTQTLTFTPPASVLYGVKPIDLSTAAKASSGLAVSFHLAGGPAKLAGSVLSITGTGSVVVEAIQAGSGKYAAATPVKKTITVNPALLTVTAKSTSVLFGKAIPALTYTLSGLVYKDPETVVTGKPVETTTAKKDSPVGHYPIAITRGTLKAANYKFAFVDGKLTVTALGTAKEPEFKPASGTYKTSASVTITDTTPGAVTHYTTNGSTPTAGSTKYTKAVTVKSTTTIKAIAVAPGYSDSQVATAKYTID
jgi:hypothetical protein